MDYFKGKLMDILSTDRAFDGLSENQRRQAFERIVSSMTGMGMDEKMDSLDNIFGGDMGGVGDLMTMNFFIPELEEVK